MRADSAGNGLYSIETKQALFLVSVFVLSVAFDVKGTAGGSPIQFVLAGISALAFILIAVHFRFTLPASGAAGYIVWCWVLFLLVGSIGTLIHKVPFEQYIRVFDSYFLFLEGFLVTWWCAKIRRLGNALIKRMMLAAVISMLFTVWWGFHFTGENISVIHFSILSPLLPFLITAAGYDLIFAYHRRVWALLLLIVGFTIIAISTVRGMLLVLTLVGCGVILTWLWNVLKGRAVVPKPLLNGVIWVLLIFIVGVLVASLFDPDAAVHWISRTTGPQRDINFWTRVAAVVGQWKELTTHVESWVFGLGFGHAYRWSSQFAPLVLPYDLPRSFEISYWYPGEFMWITPWFYGGFITGSLGIITLFIGVFISLRNFTTILNYRRWRTDSVRPIAIGALGYIGFLGLGFTSNPFIWRLAPMFMGLCLGLVFTRSTIHEFALRD